MQEPRTPETALHDLTGSPRQDSLVLSLFPWNANVIMTKRLSDIFPEDHPFHRFVYNVHEWEKTLGSPHFRSVFELQQALLMKRTWPQGEMQATTKWTVPSSVTISNLVMMYRLVEILAMEDGKTGRGMVPGHSRIPGLNNPSFKHWPKLLDWPELVFKFQKSLSNLSDMQDLRNIGSNSGILAGLLKKLSTLLKMKDGAKILMNFTIAAMHLVYLIHNDFEGTMPDLPVVTQAGIEQLRRSNSLSRDDLDILLAIVGGQEGLGLRQPLLFATLITPLVLFLPVQLHKSSFDRQGLLQTSKALGNQKPLLLSTVESRIWSALIQVVQGNTDPLSALESLATQIPWTELNKCEGSERSWFHADRGNISVSLSDNYLVGEIHDEWPLARDIRQSSPPADSSTEDSVQPGRAGFAPPTMEREDSPPQTTGPDPAPREVAPPRQSNRIVEAESKRNATTDQDELRLVKRKKQGKRKRGNSVVRPPPTAFPSSSVPIDVDAFYEMQKVNTVTLQKEDVAMKFDSYQGRTSVTVWDAKGNPTVLKPALHHEYDLEKLYRLFDAVHLVNGRPLHVEKPEESVFRVFTEKEFSSMATERVQTIIRSYNVILTDCDIQPVNFDPKGLGTLTRTGAIIDLQDQSICSSDDLNSRVKKGSLNMMLEEANSPNGRILNALDFPMPHTGVDWNSNYASDRVAWSSTEGCFMCHRDDPFPASDLYWGLAATKGAMHCLHLDPNGLATTLSPMCGGKGWFAARPKDGLHPPFADWDMYGNPFDVQSPDHSKWIIELVYLTPGARLLMRPNTPHAVFTPENSICYGSHYYSTANLQDSLFSIIHCFVGNRALTNTDHLLSRRMLQRMMAYFFEALVRGSINEEETDWGHVPHLKSFTSLIDILSLCIIIILQNILDPETYTNSAEHTDDERIATIHRLVWDLNAMPNSERYRMTHARGLAYFTVQWLDTNFLVVDAKEERELSVADDIFFPYLARVIIALQKSKRAAEKEGILGFENCTFQVVLYQISLAFDQKQDVTAALQAPGITEITHMAFDKQDTYKIHPRRSERTCDSDMDWKLVRAAGSTYGDKLLQEGRECDWLLEARHDKFYNEFLEKNETELWINEGDSRYPPLGDEESVDEEEPARKKKKSG